jgi:3-hydroxyisobutyrate dehydrogenase-like beta-hydroxyacid dehydrogenase
MLLAGEGAEPLIPALSTMTGKVWFVGERPDLAAIHKLSGNAVLVALSGTVGDLLAMGAAQGLAPEAVMALFEYFKPAGALPFIGSRVAKKGEGPASFELKMARKDVRLMIESAGGPEGLVVLPSVAAAMDQALSEGHGERDYAIYAWPRGR